MAYNYSNNHEDNFQDESAEIIGYCSICDSEIKATDKYYHYYDYDMICPKCAEGDSVAKCEKCNTYFKVEDLTEYEFSPPELSHVISSFCKGEIVDIYLSE